jgi:hypothetical protein
MTLSLLTVIAIGALSEVPRAFRTVRPLGWIIWKG